MTSRAPLLLLASALALSGGKGLPRGAEPRRQEACAAFGAGFVKLEGSDTCVKLGGAVRAEFGMTSAGRSSGSARP